MSSAHTIATKLIQQNSAVADETKKVLRYLVQRGAIDNGVYLSATTPGAANATLVPFVPLIVDGGVGYNSGGAVVGGRTYKFRMYMPCLANGTSGMVIDWQGGTATFSSFAATGFNYVGGALTAVQSAAAATPTTSGAAAYTTVITEGVFVPSQNGSFGPRIATSAGTTAPSILAGAYLQVTEIPVSI